MRRILVGAAALLLVAVAVGYAFRTRLVLRVVEAAAARNLESDLLRELPDGLHVALCGAGSPLPDPKRSGPCTAVVAGGRLFVVDVGAGAPRVLARMRIPQGEIAAVLLTHFHSDHIDGLGELLLQRWANGGHTEPVPVHGPEGVEEVVLGLDRAYAQSRRWRVAHHGPEVVPPSGAGGTARAFAAPPDGASVLVREEAGVRITAFRVSHPPIDPAVGYRFDYAGRSAVVSGDTRKSTNLERFAEGADLLVHDSLSRELVAVLTRATEAAGRDRIARITRDIVDYHASPVEAAEVAKAAGVRHLVLTHVVPPLLLAPMEAVFLDGVGDAFEGGHTLGRDGTLVMLPAGSDRVIVEERL